MMATKKSKPLSQQDFLREAMRLLGMTRDEFAERIATKRKTLDNWLLPPSESARGMPDMAWKFIREILEKESKNS
jgi:DNA-binding transcriptional regulator YiaG